MLAAIHTKYGSADVIQIKEVATPFPKKNEILIKVHATTVNRTDCAILKAKPLIMRLFTGLFKPWNPISGTDFAGEIVVVGKNVSSYKIGDRVFGFNDLGLSSHAQFMKISQKAPLSIIPTGITFEQAAASLEGAHYAYNMINKTKLQTGQKVIVNGASGAIGVGAVQLLKYFGVHVTAVCNTKNIELIKSIGADRTIDYTTEDFTKTDEKYQYIFDTVGKSSFSKCKSILEKGGAYISSELGDGGENMLYALYTPFIGKKKVIFPVPLNIMRSILLIKKLLEEGKFKPVIDRKYSFADIAEAYRYVETGQKTGNVVVSTNT